MILGVTFIRILSGNSLKFLTMSGRDICWKKVSAQNYIEHIKHLIKDDTLDYISVSSNDSVRAALVQEGIPFTLVYPSITLKEEYIQRYKDRGYPDTFIQSTDRLWTTFILGCSEQAHVLKSFLKKVNTLQMY